MSAEKDELLKRVVKSFDEKELLKVGNRTYANAFKYPDSWLDPPETGGPLLRRVAERIIPPTSLIFKWNDLVYEKKWTGQIAGGSTDASAVIQSAINALTNGGKIFIRAGLYVVNSRIAVKSNISLVGEGREVVTFKARDGLNDCMLVNEHISGISPGADKNILIEGITFDGNAPNQTEGIVAPWFANVENVIFRRNKIMNYAGIGGLFSGDPATYDQNIYCTVEDNIWNGSGQTFVCDLCDFGQMAFAVVRGNKFICGKGAVSSVNGRHFLFEGNEIIGNSSVEANGYPYAGFGAHFNLIIKNNFCRGGAHYGISLQGGEAPNPYSCQRVIVEGNIVTEASRWGIRVITKTVDVVIKGNIVYGNGFLGIGIDPVSGAPDVNAVVIGNICKNNGGYGGICIGMYAKHVIVKGNKCFDDQMTKTQAYGIYIVSGGAPDYITIEGNDLRGNGVGAIYGAENLGVNSIIRHNMGYVTENGGSATIAAGSTYIDVTHGLSKTPDINKIKVTPQDNLGGRSFWVSNVTATTFRINISSADTVDHVFGWSYE